MGSVSVRRRGAVGMVLAVVATGMVAVVGVSPVGAVAVVDRQAGVDRYGTAAEISAATFTPAATSTVYVASGVNYPDALSGAAVAGESRAPVLLVTPSGVPAVTGGELSRLDPQDIVVLGGTSAVGESVAQELGRYGTVTRLSGADRYATSVAISAAHYPAGVGTVYVASGAGFADALAGAARAGIAGGPVLLTKPEALPSVVAAELDRLDPANIVVLGGTAAVSGAVASELARYGAVTRHAGSDRYATAVEISKAFHTGGGVETVYLASGGDFPDALAGAAAAASRGALILLVKPGSIPDVVLEEIRRLNPRTVVILGGPAAISDAVANRAADPDSPVMSPEAAAALAALDGIPVTTVEAPGYDRDLFGDEWIDADGDGLDTRNEILVRDLSNVVLEDRGSYTVVLSGILDDPYTGTVISFVRGTDTSADVQIDHLVSLSAAWKMGANTWTTARRVDFYNDFDALLAVDGPTNNAKGDDTLGEWLPPNTAFHCEYAITYIEVTDKYDLALTPVDVTRARALLPDC